MKRNSANDSGYTQFLADNCGRAATYKLLEFKPMQRSSLIKFISVGIFATGVMVVPMTSPASAQVTTPSTGSQGTTTNNYDNNRNDNSGLWGLSGLVGLFGLMGRGKENNDSTTRRA